MASSNSRHLITPAEKKTKHPSASCATSEFNGDRFLKPFPFTLLENAGVSLSYLSAEQLPEEKTVRLSASRAGIMFYHRFTPCTFFSAKEHDADPFKHFPITILQNILIPYLGKYAPCLWIEGLKEEKEKREIIEIKFKLTKDGCLEYTFRDACGKKIITHNKIYSQTELNNYSLQKPLTQEQLDQLWPDLWRIIASREQVRYDMEEMNKLAASSVVVYQLLKKDLAKHLVQLVAWGRRDQVENMIRINPRLLLEESCVEDYAKRRFIGNPLAIALSYRDMGMVEMMEAYVMSLPEGKLAIVEQQQAQFPEGYEVKEEEKYQRDLAALNKVTQAICNAETEEECRNAYRRFRKYFESQGEIRTGKQCNIKLFIAAFELYWEHFGYFYQAGKSNIFWKKVLGYIIRLLPTHVAIELCRAIALAIDGLVEKEKLDYYFRIPREWDILRGCALFR